MNKMLKKSLVVALAAASTFTGSAFGASGTSTATPASVANAVNFSVTIPGFLFFRVGTVGSTDTVSFAVPAANVGNSTPVAGTGGDAGGTGVNVTVLGNRSQVTISTAVTGGGSGMGTGTPADGFISFDRISTTSTNANLAAPALLDAAIVNTTPLLGSGAAGRVTNQTAVWNYSYLNTTTPSAGTYTGTATYTAAMP